MGHVWMTSRQIHQVILAYVCRHRRVTARQVEQHLAARGYAGASARWHLNRLVRAGRLRKIGGPTYYEVSE